MFVKNVQMDVSAPHLFVQQKFSEQQNNTKVLDKFATFSRTACKLCRDDLSLF
jgi:hypothetical protein